MSSAIPLKTINQDGTVSIKNGIKPNKYSKIESQRKPDWLRVKPFSSSNYLKIKKDLKNKELFTVCEEAMCPNLSECWNHGTATFMLMGGICTRACKFCAVDTGNPHQKLDKDEPNKIVNSIIKMGLDYVVLTSVNRDDLEDGGAEHYALTIEKIRQEIPDITIEALTPDFKGSKKSVETLVLSGLDVFAQNLETVKRLTTKVRDPRASFEQTLEVLSMAKELNPNVLTKTSLMLGLGEKEYEVIEAMQEVISCGVEIITLGQYLRPTKNHIPVEKWVEPEEFDRYALIAKDIGFKEVASGPLVRSSYRADKSAYLVKEKRRLKLS
ncbi:MAG: lipoyl synthase [Gammaproteobacteria bacterium]|nr:lipoyl synthase [Gammaproteobacteria bacterium]RZO97416.1 MAG: lipoyl synthase [Gammaproteobacteria bacterium]|tara:strand:- start:1249 stop:2226 length:978 start_codon:yes stop_codon:yes gene_type:complete